MKKFYNFGARSRWHPTLSLPPPFLLTNFAIQWKFVYGAITKMGELCLSGNHTVTEYEMSGESYSQKSGWKIHSNERIFKVMTFKTSIH